MTVLSIDLTEQIIQQLFLRNTGIIKLGSSTPSASEYLNLAGMANKYFPGTVSCDINRGILANLSSRIEDYVKLFNITDSKENKVLAANRRWRNGRPLW